MTQALPLLQRFVRRALVDATGTASPDRTQLAAAFDSRCERLRDRLQPVFGTAAVSALFARALHLATGDYPWLADVLPNNQQPCSVDRLNGLDPRTFEEGLAAVLAHNIGLLSAFVGDDLILPLVQHAWGIDAAAEGPATEDDHD